MSVEQAMNVLRAHRNALRGDGRRGPGNYGGPPKLEEVRASIPMKVRAIIAARGTAEAAGGAVGEGGAAAGAPGEG
jgi:hypothetical protein